MEKEFQKLYESVNRLNEGADKKYTYKDIYRLKGSQYNDWNNSQEHKDMLKALANASKGSRELTKKCRALEEMADYLTRVKNKLEKTVKIKAPTIKENQEVSDEVKAILTDAVDIGTKAEKAYMDTLGKVLTEWTPKLEEKITALRKEVTEVWHAINKAEDEEDAKRDAIESEYITKWFENNMPKEYTVDTTTYANVGNTDWYNTDWNIDPTKNDGNKIE